jgi:hypothetical protein
MSAPALDLSKKASLAQSILALSSSDKPQEELIIEIVMLVKKASEMEAVGVRLADGLDYPYYFTNGFDADFVRKEMHLCARDDIGEIIRDSEGNPMLECMCGNIIYGRVDPSLPFFSKGGSFWSNCTTELLATTTEKERQTRTRNRCNGEGYESVALIPIKTDRKIYGLLQLNDRRKGMFTSGDILFYEGIAATIGIVFCAVQANRALAEKANDALRLASVRIRVLEKISDQMKNSPDLADNRSLLEKLDAVIDEINTLKGTFPICSVCKKIRTDVDYWQQVEGFIRDRSEAKFTHTFCPECHRKWREQEGL